MGALTLSNLTKHFESKELFCDLSFTFPQSGLFLLLGESGSGKTTLLRMIAGLDTDYTGSIEGGGSPNVSMAFQEHRLLPVLTAIGNVTEALRPLKIDKKEAEARAKEALLLLGFPEKDFKTRPAALSGGMRQRVSLARAFAVDRPILLLDEPEKELDATLRDRLYTAIEVARKSHLVIITTHTPDRLLPMADGVLALSPKNA
jgi:ABC-type nitrate/sulfonate/bicarbonate transport system ATPase subunit